MLSQTLSRLLANGIAIILRRFTLLTVPVLVGLMLIPIMLLTLPRSYSAATLLLLQESSNDTPLARELRYSENVGEKVAGLQALLKSDRLLTEVLAELHGPFFAKDRKAAAHMKDGLRKVLSLTSAGGDFIEIQYRSNKAQGMGRVLEVVTSRLIESVVSSDIGSVTAPQFVERRLSKRVDEATRALEDFEALFAAATAAKVPNGPSRWTKEDLVRERADSSEHRKMLSAELVKARQSAGVMGGVMGGRQEGRQDKVAVARTSDEGKETRPPAAEPSVIKTASRPKGSPREVEAAMPALLEIEMNTRDERISVLDALIETAGAGELDPAVWVRARAALTQRLEVAATARRAWLQRIDARAGGKLAFLRAPERMVVVDSPSDPDQPTNSRAKIALVILASSLMFGLGLTGLAEVFDNRVRSVQRLATVSGVVVLGRIPWMPPVPPSITVASRAPAELTATEQLPGA